MKSSLIINALVPNLTAKTMLVSTFSGIATTLATNPFWVLNTKMATANSNFKGKNMINVAFEMIKGEGWQSLFKGLFSSLALVMNPIIQFTLYENLLKDLPFKKSAFLSFFVSAFAKMVSTLVTYPYQTIRANQHISKGKRGSLSIGKALIKESGYRALYKGLKMKMIQTILNAAITMGLYESIGKPIKNILVWILILILRNQNKKQILLE